jgi:hypothetical protein
VLEAPIPRPSTIVPGFPPSLERILARLLRRDAGARPSSAGALRAELLEHLREVGERGDEAEVGRYLAALYRAPRHDEAPDFDEGEVDRGMPEVAAAPEPKPEPKRDPKPEPRREIPAPIRDPRREDRASAPRRPAREPHADETPPRRWPWVTPGVVAGSAMMAVALALLVAYFVVH